MHHDLNSWAARWGVPLEAMVELLQLAEPTVSESRATTESGAQSETRLEAAENGCILWRNNVGAGLLENGSFVRWGLANDSKALNARVKSHDLIGVRRVLVTPDMVGKTFGQFLSREIKQPGWGYSGTDREKAQLAFATIVNSLGGDAKFSTGRGSI